jgi:TonB family protein
VLSQYVAPAPGACPEDGGVAIVHLQVTPKGLPDHVELIEAPGGLAGPAALAAVRSWKFQPGVLNGNPRKASGTVELHCRTAQTIAARSSESSALATAQRVGLGTSAPVPIYKPEPEHSEVARQAKYQGKVVFALIVDTSGHAVHISVLQPLGMGLDQQAMGAVSQWRFKPGMKDGKPVNIAANLEVNFRLM